MAADPPATVGDALRVVALVVREVRALPPGLADRPVVVVAGPGDRAALVLKPLARALRRRVVLVRPSPRLAADLAELGPCAAVVDLAGGRRWRRRLATSWFHVAAGGLYVQRLRAAQRAEATTLAADVARDSVARHVRRPLGLGRRADDRRHLLTAMHEPRVVGDLLVAHQRLDVVLKVRDDEHDRVAAGRGLGFGVLERRPAASYTASGRVRTSRPHPLHDLAPEVEAPEAVLRHHDDVVCRPGQVAVQGSVVLPTTFRRPTAPRLQTTALVDVHDEFVLPPRGHAPRLDGTYFHLDSEVPRHFGHTMTEVLPRLWGWDAARAAYPGLRALLVEPGGARRDPWWLDLLDAAGVGRDDVVVARGPVRVERLVTATPLYSVGAYAHPDLRAVYDRVGARLERLAGGGKRPSRVFLTRDQPARRCRNRAGVEQLFAAYDFAIVAPETLPMAEQVALVRQADVVAGFAGSNLLHLGLCDRPQQVVVLTSDTYHLHNEHLMCALRGHDLAVAVSRADQPRPGTGFDMTSYRSTFAVDPNDEGAFLVEVLAGL